jgi:alkylation response protein AidB-like acyl-CoA dehydrogenase
MSQHPSDDSGADTAIEQARAIGSKAQPFAEMHDRTGTFVHEGYAAIRETAFGAIAAPRELGGGGAHLGTVCKAQAILASYCASTSLAIAMHQHNVLSLSRRWRLGDESVKETLRRIVEDQLILASSGTSDVSRVAVSAIRTHGGIRVSGQKRYCSGSPGADVLATIAGIIDDSEPLRTVTVLVPLRTPGVELIPNWDAMGMRGSGSNSVVLTEAFVPDKNVISQASMPLPASNSGDGTRRAVRLPGLLIALPVISAVYVGIARGIYRRALRLVSGTSLAHEPQTHRFAGLMTQELRSAWWALDAAVRVSNDAAIGTERHFVTIMLAKRQTVLSAIAVAEIAMEMVGGRSYFRSFPFEQAVRDARAALTHPLTPEATLIEVGKSQLENVARN